MFSWSFSYRKDASIIEQWCKLRHFFDTVTPCDEKSTTEIAHHEFRR